MIKKLLIANRGEIVCRIHRTCRRLGIQTATVHSIADRDSVHVRTVGESVEIGPAPSAQSYLNINAVLAAARAVGADAIHPGIGFLSEEPAFAEAAAQACLLFIGPSADSLRRFGDKWSAKREARKAGVPVIGGSEVSSNDPREIESLIREQLKLPVVLKAVAGGGGRGVRIIRDLDGLAQNIESAMREALASFGRGDLIVEEFITAAQHIEVQIAGDGNGNAIHMFERECSLQRRFQKVVEEAPAFKLDDALRQRILADAVRLAESVKYANLGTVEFLVSGGFHHFLECNQRLQVEHTVTEAITGLDLVECQIRDGQVDACRKNQALGRKSHLLTPGAGDRLPARQDSGRVDALRDAQAQPPRRHARIGPVVPGIRTESSGKKHSVRPRSSRHDPPGHRRPDGCRGFRGSMAILQERRGPRHGRTRH